MSYTRIKKVIVGISGGVDSSVAAWLLQQQGYQVEGVFIKCWENEDQKNVCGATHDLLYARSVCNTLGIHLYTVNFAKEYWDNVFKIFLKEYSIGRTPNPDILCNKEIKFKYFMEFACEDLQADFIATGHYVNKVNCNTDTYLLRGADNNKDQSYFLYTLNNVQLKKCLFPLGTYTKSQVRNIAKKLQLITANKKNSTGICFIGKRKFKDFLSRYIPIQPGNIYSIEGEKLGRHQGIQFYTLGQRTGLKIGGIRQGNGKPWYIVDKDITRNILIVAQDHHHPYLMSNAFIIEQTNWITKHINTSHFSCVVKTRYRQPDVSCNVSFIAKETYQVVLNTPIAAVTPGQSAVLYLKELCLGGGIILKKYFSQNFYYNLTYKI